MSAIGHNATARNREQRGVFMTQSSKILVAGATGTVGRELAAQLSDSGTAVRALVRDPESVNLPAGVELMRGDLADPASLSSPLEGVETMFLIWPFTSERAATEIAPPVVAAITQRVQRVVYLSADAAADNADRFWARLERLIERSAHEFTFLRPTGFAKNTLMWASQIRAGEVVRWPYGAAARSLIDERDIAAVALRALTETGHTGATCPRTLTQIEQLGAIAEAIGRSLRWEEISRKDARPALVTAFGDGAFADSALDTWARFVVAPERTTQTVQEITGSPAHSLGEWAAHHADDFR
jgi:uncharacterized protein YbjT (DUF2867 family)